MAYLTRQDAPRRESAFERVAAMDPQREKLARQQLKRAARAEQIAAMRKAERGILVERLVDMQHSIHELYALLAAWEERVRVLEAEVRREGRAA